MWHCVSSCREKIEDSTESVAICNPLPRHHARVRGVRRGLGPLVRRLQQHRLLQPGAPEEGDTRLGEDLVIHCSACPGLVSAQGLVPALPGGELARAGQLPGGGPAAGARGPRAGRGRGGAGARHRARPRPRPALPRLLLPHHRLQVRGVRRAAVRARVRGGGQLPAPRRVRHSGALRGGGRGGHHAVHHTTEVPAAADLGPRQVRTLPVELGTKVHTNVCNHVKKNPG